MAYSQVGISRFYCNVPEWLDSTGDTAIANEQLRTLPVNLKDPVTIPLTLKGMTDYSFVAILGHTFYNAGGGAYFQILENGSATTLTNVVNGSDGSTTSYPASNGYTINTFTGSDTIDEFWVSSGDYAIGSVVIGTYFDMPHSPDMKLTLSYETGTKTIETLGGASLSNTMWRPPMWGGLGPWELNDPNNETTGQALAHSSRRTWDLSFSFMSQESTFPKYNALNRYANTEDLDFNDLSSTEDETLLDSDDFFSQVYNRIGSSLPCIFQPDNTVPEFAIVKIVGNSLKVTQVSHRTYTIKLKLREAW